VSGDDIGGSVRAAFDKLEGGGGVAEATPEPVSAPVETAPVEAQESAPEPVEAAESAAPGNKPAPATQKQPTAKPAPPNGAPAAVTPAAAEPPKAATPDLKAPQSWKPSTREKWASLDPEVRAEVVRREKEVQHALQQSATHRQVSEQFRAVVDPYLGMIQAEGGDPYKAVGSLLQTAAALRTAPPQYKGHLIASIINQFGVPLEAVNAALGGQPAQTEPTQQQPFDPDALYREFERRHQSQQQARLAEFYKQNADREVQKFIESGKAEFFDDLRPMMAALMQGRVAASLEEAYNMAARSHPEVSKVLAQREQAAQATATQAATQRAKVASSSVASRPVGATAPKVDTVRSAIEAAWSNASGR